MREHNLTTALQLVLSGDGLATRATIARRTALTSATVSSLLAGLIADGLVLEGRLAENTGGKRATTLRVGAEHNVLLSVIVQPGLVRGAVVDLLGHVVTSVAHRTTTTVTLGDVRAVVRRLAATTTERA
ncbi:hypothetical protein ACPPVW_13510 [Leifsonia sp. McL0607]|uniref:hypothetical protein n=1 Tax=Leifsonia sp. McL0607 TaxID=3415672 RepID=UPI003CE8C98A